MDKIVNHNNKRVFYNNSPLTIEVYKVKVNEIIGYFMYDSLVRLRESDLRKKVTIEKKTILYPVVKSIRGQLEFRLLTMMNREVTLMSYINGQFNERTNNIGTTTSEALKFFDIEDYVSKYYVSNCLDAVIFFSPNYLRDYILYQNRRDEDEAYRKVQEQLPNIEIDRSNFKETVRKFAEFTIKSNAELLVYYSRRRNSEKYLTMNKIPISAKFDNVPNPLINGFYRKRFEEEMIRIGQEQLVARNISYSTRGGIISPNVSKGTRIEYINIFKMYDFLEKKGEYRDLDLRNREGMKEFIIKALYENIVEKDIFYKGGKIQYFDDSGEEKIREAKKEEALDPNYISNKEIILETVLGESFNNAEKIINRR